MRTGADMRAHTVAASGAVMIVSKCRCQCLEGFTLLVLAQVDILFCYFGIRKFATHWVSLGFFCMLVPLSTFTPEVCSQHPHTLTAMPLAFLHHPTAEQHS